MRSDETPVENTVQDAARIPPGVEQYKKEPGNRAAFVDAGGACDSSVVHDPPSSPLPEYQTGVWGADGPHDAPISSALNIGDMTVFPSLSTAAQFSTLSKRKRVQRGALESLNISEANTSFAPTVPQSPFAKKWSELPKDIDLPATASMQPQIQIEEPSTLQVPMVPCQGTSVAQHGSFEVHGADIMQPAFPSIQPANAGASTNISDSAKNKLNVDSPSFTPAQLQSGAKKSTFSSQTLNAAPFTPKGVANCE
jgi:hypothetical protein